MSSAGCPSSTINREAKSRLVGDGRPSGRPTPIKCPPRSELLGPAAPESAILSGYAAGTQALSADAIAGLVEGARWSSVLSQEPLSPDC